MLQYEFKVMPAPRRGEKARGVKTTEERYALALTTLMNDLGREGWDYVRADMLPVDERAGFTGTKTTYQHMLVFRRVIEARAKAAEPIAKSSLVAIDDAQVPASTRKLGPAESASVGTAPAVGSAAGVAAE
jgi:hypothetical protein